MEIREIEEARAKMLACPYGVVGNNGNCVGRKCMAWEWINTPESVRITRDGSIMARRLADARRWIYTEVAPSGYCSRLYR